MAPTTSKKSQLAKSAGMALEPAAAAAAPVPEPAEQPVAPAPGGSADVPADAVEPTAAATDAASAKVSALLALGAALTAEHATLGASLKAFLSQLKALQKDVKALEKAALAPKRGGKAAASGEAAKPRPPSGFALPTRVSAELAAFLGEPADILISRTDANRRITAYVKENSLFDPSNKRIIKPDAKLKALLGLDGPDAPTGDVTYFNLQSFMKQHFKKADVPAAAAPAPAPATE